MRKTFYIALLHLKTTYQSRSALVFGLAMPIVFTLVIGAAMRGAAGSGSSFPETWRLDVVNTDGGELGAQLIEELLAQPALDVAIVDSTTAEAELDAEDAAASLHLPEDFSIRLLAGQAVELGFTVSMENAISGQVVEQAVQAALNKVSSALDIAAASLRVADRVDLFGAEGGPNRVEYQQAALARAQTELQDPPVTVVAEAETQREETGPGIPFGFQQASPGNAVIFAMFFIMFATGSLLLERERGTLPRLMITPVSRAAIIGGKLMGVYVAGVLQFTIMVVFGALALGVDWGAQPLGVALMVLAFTFSVTGLGMMVAALARSHAQLDAIATVLIMPLAGLGGAMWPIEIVPAWMQKLALYLPSGIAMHGFQDLITRGLGTQDVLLEAGALAAFGLVFLAIGVWRFRYE